MKTALLVFSEQDAPIRLRLEGHLNPDPEIVTHTASNVEKAIRVLREVKCDYLVVGGRLAADATSPALPAGGVDFCRQARRETTLPICLLLATQSNAIQEAIESLDPKPTIFVDAPDVCESIQRAIGRVAVVQRTLEIRIVAAAGATWRYKLSGINFSFDAGGELRVRSSGLVALKNLSNALNRTRGNGPWYESFRELGEYIISAFSDGSEQFVGHVNAGLEEAGGIENTRIVFEIDAPDHRDTVLEAIFWPPNNPAEPLMVRAPTLRQINSRIPTGDSLFRGARRALRCLIVQADTSGIPYEVVDGIPKPLVDNVGAPVELPTLKHLGHEVDSVKSFLEDPANSVAISEVKVLGTEGGITYRELVDELKKRWDIVHYLGHSLWKYTPGREERAYIFLGNRDDPVAIDIGDFTPFMRGVKLLYLSSCESGNAGFAAVAANAGIPAVIGFRWPVGDETASRYARLFYRQMLMTAAIDDAFHRTRSELHKNYPHDHAWASSMYITCSQATQA